MSLARLKRLAKLEARRPREFVPVNIIDPLARLEARDGQPLPPTNPQPWTPEHERLMRRLDALARALSEP